MVSGQNLDIKNQEAETENAVLPPSVRGYRWVWRNYDERVSIALMQKFGLSEIIARLLAIRGLTPDTAEDFLEPRLNKLLPDPSHLLDMDKAALRLVDAVIAGENVVIFGDYDVDGATSAALLKKFFAMVGLDVKIYIPDRLAEGYGPNIEALLKLKKDGANLVVTVDCGATSFDQLTAAKKANLDVIVIDHHIGMASLPEAIAVVNPNRIDEISDCRNLAAVGVCFLLIVAVKRLLRERNWFTPERSEPDILTLLDLVALGTICDVMPLIGLNRAFVKQGLKIMGQRRNIGLAALADVARMQEAPSTYHAGFLLGPRINAGGRIGKAALGANLLTTTDAEEARDLSEKLDKLNSERQAIEALVMDEASRQAEVISENNPVIFVIGKGWHQGVVGIVAGRLKEIYNKPVVAISLENGIGKASSRSVEGVNLGAAVASARMEGLLIAGGGHAMAAGFTMEEGKVDEVIKFITEQLREQVLKYIETKTLKLDGALSLSAINTELIKELEKIGPFGTGNPQPRFLVENARVIKVQQAGMDHIMCILGNGGPAGDGRNTVKAMAFRAVGTPLGNALFSNIGKDIQVAGKIKLNRWNGIEKAEFTIEDVIV